MQGRTTALETSNSSASSHEVNQSLAREEPPKDRPSSHHTLFATTEEDYHSVVNEDFSESKLYFSNR